MPTLREIGAEIARATSDVGQSLSRLILDTDVRPILVFFGYIAITGFAIALAYGGVMGFVHLIADIRANKAAFRNVVADLIALTIVGVGLMGSVFVGVTISGYAGFAVIGATALLIFVLAKRGRKLGSAK